MATQPRVLPSAAQQNINSTAIGALALWGGWLTHRLESINGEIEATRRTLFEESRFDILASLLKTPSASSTEAGKKFAAAAILLNSFKAATAPIAPGQLHHFAHIISTAQSRYPFLPQIAETVAALINYRFRSLRSSAGLIRQVGDGSSCKQTTGIPGGFQYINGSLTLDGLTPPLGGIHAAMIDGHPYSIPFVFEDCVIRYSGGAIPHAPFVFRNCTFLLAVESVPSPAGMKLMQSLATASNLREIQIEI